MHKVEHLTNWNFLFSCNWCRLFLKSPFLACYRVVTHESGAPLKAMCESKVLRWNAVNGNRKWFACAVFPSKSIELDTSIFHIISTQIFIMAKRIFIARQFGRWFRIRIRIQWAHTVHTAQCTHTQHTVAVVGIGIGVGVGVIFPPFFNGRLLYTFLP